MCISVVVPLSGNAGISVGLGERSEHPLSENDRDKAFKATDMDACVCAVLKWDIPLICKWNKHA